ncbi:hypothetical protein F0562_021639 [Nyssa sinensis]|uniref:HIT domain-containing protein n=1 Tax=Nyssa sinensis TaxID=561372 RepID=A0A5J5BKE3_9ASTE|nr:hypothetical protein F0562_021639 [Nyssa sinensis]
MNESRDSHAFVCDRNSRTRKFFKPMVKLLVPSLSSKGFITLCSSKGLRPIATTSTIITTTRVASDHRFHIARASSSSGYTHPKMESEHYTFGPYKIHHKEVFYSTELSYAVVNLRPVVPGHILLNFSQH